MKRKIALAFALGMAVGIGLSTLAWRLTHGAGPLAANRQRDMQAMVDSGLEWAESEQREGLANFHQVSEVLLRGAQPTAEGMRTLEAMGVRTIVNLRKLHSDRDALGDSALRYEHITLNTMHPETHEVVRFLRIVTNAELQPVFVHCKHGSDRTGMMVAVYRVAVEGWTVEQAIAEWTLGGFGFHQSFRHLVKFFRELDFEQIKREAGLAPAATTTQPVG